MPPLTTSADSDRPAGRFILEHIVQRWDQLNRYSSAQGHVKLLSTMLRRNGVQEHALPGNEATFHYNGSITGGRRGLLTTLVSDFAYRACTSTSVTRQMCGKAGVPVLPWQVFEGSDVTGIRRALEDAKCPQVVRPDSGRRHRGLSFNPNPADASDAAQVAVQASLATPGESPSVVVENFYDGLVLRCFVVGNRVAAATVRLPLFVVGDGQNTIESLLADSWEHRQRHAYLARNLRSVSQDLISPGTGHLTEIPDSGELRILQHNVSIGVGGLTVNLDGSLSPDLTAMAEAAAEAVPGAGAVAIDILTPSVGSAQDAVVMDMSVTANALMHRYPAFGRPHAAIGAIAKEIRLRAQYWERPSSAFYPPSPQYVEQEVG